MFVDDSLGDQDHVAAQWRQASDEDFEAFNQHIILPNASVSGNRARFHEIDVLGELTIFQGTKNIQRKPQ